MVKPYQGRWHGGSVSRARVVDTQGADPIPLQVMPTSPDDPELQDELGPHDPRRRALVRGGKLHGDTLKAEIRRLAGEGLSTREIAEAAKASRAYVHRILTAKPAAEERIGDDLLAWMVEQLRHGASPAALLDGRPEIAGLFRRRGDAGDAAEERERVLASLRVFISSGRDSEDAQRVALYRARQEGRLKGATPAAGPQPSEPATPRRRGK